MDWAMINAISAGLATLVLLVTALFIREQVSHAQRNRTDQLRLATLSTYSRLTEKMVEIDKHFLADPDLKEYFYSGKPAPADPETRSRVSVMAEWICDFMEEMCVHQEVFKSFDDWDEGIWAVWNKFFRDTYRSSPAIRALLAERGSWFRVDLLKAYGIADSVHGALIIRQYGRADRPLLDGVRRIYSESFPPSEQLPFETIEQSITDNTRRLTISIASVPSHTVVGLAITCDVGDSDNAVVLEYLAVAEEQRSAGVGSELLAATLALEADRGRDGLVLEIESDEEEGLSEGEIAIRKRRLAFYRRNDGRLVSEGRGVRMPRLDGTGGSNLMKLIWMPLHSDAQVPNATEVRALHSSILVGSYGVEPESVESWFDDPAQLADDLVEKLEALRARGADPSTALRLAGLVPADGWSSAGSS